MMVGKKLIWTNKSNSVKKLLRVASEERKIYNGCMSHTQTSVAYQNSTTQILS